MQGIEQLIRESLQARATDVEPTPALWREVDRRVARRKRFQVMTWSLAGATAALAAVVAAPTIVDFVQPDRRPDIGAVPMTEGPAAGVVSDLYVTDVDGYLSLFEVGSGGPVSTLPEGVDPFAVPAEEIAVRPGSTSADGAVVARRGSTIEVVTTGMADGDRWRETVTHTLPDEGDLGGFETSVAWAPDQDRVAYLLPTEDQVSLVLWDPSVEAEAGTGVAPAAEEVGLVFGLRDTDILDWVGETTDTGDQSVLYYRTGGRVHQVELTVAPDGTLQSGETRPLDGWHDVASAHGPGGTESPWYAIVSKGGPVLVWNDAGTARSAELDVTEVFGDVDPATLWLDAKQDAALVGDGERTFLFAHDGAGNFVDPVELDTPGPAALFDAMRPGEPQPEPTSSEPVPDESTSEGPVPTETESEGEAGASVLPEPVVTVTTREMVLHGPDGEQVLYTLPSEGHSSFLSVAVRPGSTIDDLTIVALHLAEGMQDFRTYRYVDGELSVIYWDSLQYQPGFEGDLGGPVAAFGPVWHPSGDKLAWIERGTSPTPRLRIVGWAQDMPGTGDTATDNASWLLEEFDGMVVEPLEWVDLGDGQTEIRAVSEDFLDSWISIPIEIQADGGPALTGSADFGALAEGGTDRVGGVAGVGPRWLLQGDTVHLLDDRSVSVTLPPEFFPGEGLPDTWMREIGDGVLVGMSNTGTVYYVSADGDLAQVGDGAWMHGDVVD